MGQLDGPLTEAARRDGSQSVGYYGTSGGKSYSVLPAWPIRAGADRARVLHIPFSPEARIPSPWANDRHCQSCPSAAP